MNASTHILRASVLAALLAGASAPALAAPAKNIVLVHGAWVDGSTLQRALDLGVTLFDTAEIYGMGKSERILGEALGDKRSTVALASKIFPIAPFPPVIKQRERASARTEEELIQQVAQHAAQSHGIKEVTPELAEKVKSAIETR